jgi:hypothetical protein
VRLEGLGQLKNPMTSSGIEPATFRLVAQCPNQLRYLMPLVNFKWLCKQPEYHIIITICIPVAPSGALGIREAPFHVSFIVVQTVGRTPWTGDQPDARPQLTQNTNRINADIHDSSGIRTHYPSVSAGEDISCLRPRCH